MPKWPNREKEKGVFGQNADRSKQMKTQKGRCEEMAKQKGKREEGKDKFPAMEKREGRLGQMIGKPNENINKNERRWSVMWMWEGGMGLNLSTIYILLYLIITLINFRMNKTFHYLVIFLHFLNFYHSTPNFHGNSTLHFLHQTTTFVNTPTGHDRHPPYSKLNNDQSKCSNQNYAVGNIWTKQNLISEILRNYIQYCGTVAIVKENSLDLLRDALASGHANDPNILDEVDIFIDMSLFCNQRDIPSHHIGHLPDCFHLPRSIGIQRLMHHYGVNDRQQNDRKLACEINDEMEKRKVDDDNVDLKQMILDELANNEGLESAARGYHPHPIPDPIHHHNMHSYHPPPPLRIMMPPPGMIPSTPSQPFAILFQSFEAAAILWYMADLLDRLSILYYSANLIRVHINTQTRVKIHNRGLNSFYQMDMRVYSRSLPKDACRILYAREDVFKYFMMITSSNTDDRKLDEMFTRVKEKIRNIQYKIQMPVNTVIGKYNANCIEDLFLLRAMLEFYRSLIKAVQAWISLIKQNDLQSHKTFCDIMQPQCQKKPLNLDLSDMKMETDFMIQVVERWFQIKLDEYNYMNWKTFRRNNIDEKFHVQIIDTPKNTNPSNIIKKFRQSIFQKRRKPARRQNYTDFVGQQNRMRVPMYPKGHAPYYEDEDMM